MLAVVVVMVFVVVLVTVVGHGCEERGFNGGGDLVLFGNRFWRWMTMMEFVYVSP